ncbi:hypothetical protein [Pseudonocardia sp. NPDC049635]|uniref:hypothetical protein n=1 Tax=Pseudonocardia sp. NPDC049635 TaxID=3155506 RepID=UPI0033CF9F8E
MAEHACCSEYNCRRKQPILVRPEPFGGGWVAVTKYRKRGANGLVADEKHRLDPVSQAEIELNGSVLHDLFDHVKQAWSGTEDDSEADRAYRDVLDKIAELTEARKAALLGAPAAVSSAGPEGDHQ